MELGLWLAALIASLAFLVKGADLFIGAAERIGLAFGLSPFIIGVTIVAVGTSLPELVAGISSVFQGASEIAVGTAVGSNITNILLVLGVTAIAGRGLTVAYELVRVDLPFLFGSSLALALFAWNGEVQRLEGVVLLCALAIYISYAISSPDDAATSVAASASVIEPSAQQRGPVGIRTWIALPVSGAVVHLGAYFTIQSSVEISTMAGIPPEVIATSLIAFATSLPEFTISIRSALRGQPEVAVGNVIGSNIFNALGVVGASALFGRLHVPDALTSLALPSMIGTTALCFFVLQEREMTHWDGWLLLVLYFGFMLQLFGFG